MKSTKIFILALVAIVSFQFASAEEEKLTYTKNYISPLRDKTTYYATLTYEVTDTANNFIRIVGYSSTEPIDGTSYTIYIPDAFNVDGTAYYITEIAPNIVSGVGNVQVLYLYSRTDGVPNRSGYYNYVCRKGFLGDIVPQEINMWWEANMITFEDEDLIREKLTELTLYMLRQDAYPAGLFKNYRNLKKVLIYTVDVNVTKLDSELFANCTSLSNIEGGTMFYKRTTPLTIEPDTFRGVNLRNIEFQVYNQLAFEQYVSQPIWREFGTKSHQGGDSYVQDENSWMTFTDNDPVELTLDLSSGTMELPLKQHTISEVNNFPAGNVKWESSNPEVATVPKTSQTFSNTITAVSPGWTRITAYYNVMFTELYYTAVAYVTVTDTPKTANLDLKYGSGVVTYVVPGGQATTLSIEDESDYTVHSVTLNDTEITPTDGVYTIDPLTADASLNVVYAAKSNTTNDIKVLISNNIVNLTGGSADTAISLYNSDNECVLSTTEQSFTIPTQGLYRLTVGDQTFRFVY